MAFRTRGSGTILQRLITWTSTKTDKLTDFNPGSAVRTLLESVALQIEEFYYDLKLAVQFAIKNSAYHAFGFVKKGAKRASGKVMIYYRDALTHTLFLPKGTEFHTGNMRIRKVYFISTENIQVQPGAQVAIVPVICREYGEIGNAQAGEICKLSVGNANVHFITNTEDFIDGKDVETEAERELRFREYVHTLQRGTAEAVAYGIKQVEGVHGVFIDDTHIGFVHAYVHDKDGNLSTALKQEVLLAVDSYRSGGIEVEIRPIVKKIVDLDINVHYRQGADPLIFDPVIKGHIENYINDLKASESLYLSSLITAINDSFRDVVAYIDVKEEEDRFIQNNELLRAGTIQINA